MSKVLRFDGRKDGLRRAFVEHHGVFAFGVVDRVFRRYVKITPTFATRVMVPFEVETLEGLHTGKAGDYLAVGAHGEMYPIDAAIMEATYREETP